MQMHTVVFMRKSDGHPKDGDPGAIARGKRLGVARGAQFAPALRQMGYEVDDGAADSSHNIDKLLLRRIDAYVVSLANPGDMDAFVAARYNNDAMRFDRPIRVANIWLPASKAFYASRRETAEALWDWLGTKAGARFAQILKKYDPE
jgi:hypothetical protein